MNIYVPIFWCVNCLILLDIGVEMHVAFSRLADFAFVFSLVNTGGKLFHKVFWSVYKPTGNVSKF